VLEITDEAFRRQPTRHHRRHRRGWTAKGPAGDEEAAAALAHVETPLPRRENLEGSSG
jgi:hypothetical protein